MKPPERNTKLVDSTLAEVEFLRSELLTGLTLAKIALDANREDRRNRNLLKSRKAYDALVRFMPRVRLTPEERHEIESKMEHLKSELAKLGEKF